LSPSLTVRLDAEFRPNEPYEITACKALARKRADAETYVQTDGGSATSIPAEAMAVTTAEAD